MKPKNTPQQWPQQEEESQSLNLSNDHDTDDFPSLLRPCKRNKAPLRPCTATNDPHSISLSEPQQPSATVRQTLVDFSQPQSVKRRIPGPAGAVQAAISRRLMSCGREKSSGSRFEEETSCGREKSSGSRFEEETVVSTQEYLRRAVEDGDEHDDDFSDDCWLSAIEFVRANGLGDADSLGTPLNVIKSSREMFQRIPRVVAMIKTLAPKGLGAALLTLKDPSGTIGASIHHSVFVEEEYGKNISVGAVMILKKIVAFTPSRSAYYLNITPANVITVISKDCGPPSRNFSSAVKYSTPDIVEILGSPYKICAPVRVSSESILSSMRTKQGDAHTIREPPSSHENLLEGPESETLSVGQDLIKEGIAEEMTPEEHTNVNGQGGVQLGQKSNPAIQLDEVNTDQTMQDSKSNEAPDGNQILTASSKTSLPEWTDEQLEELFAMEDDAFAF